ncbi:MAG TPA: type VI secretion system protein TssL, partial [Dyella sp.]|nr:type VI secretion system protein TssL [Dyella sp.]
MRDATVVRPRGAAPAAAPGYAAAPAHGTPVPAADMGNLLDGGTNPLVRAASPLLLLGVQVRHSVTPPDAA